MDVGRSGADRARSTGCASRTRCGRIVIDEGWSLDRDVSILVGRWSWIDVRALVEEHGGGKSLLRISTHLRPTTFGVVSSIAARRGAAQSHRWRAWRCVIRWPARPRRLVAVSGVAFAAYRIAQATANLQRGVQAITVGRGMTALASGPARLPLLSPSLLRVYGLRTATVFVIALLAICHRHLHAARGRDRTDHRRAQRLRRRQRAGHRGVARHAGRRRRRAVGRTVHRRLEQSRHPPHRRGQSQHLDRRRQQFAGRRLLGRFRSGHRVRS